MNSREKGRTNVLKMKKAGSRLLQAVCLALAVMAVIVGSRPVEAKPVPVAGFVMEPSTIPNVPGLQACEGATVMIMETKETDTTDARGAFIFYKVKAGEVTLIARKPGFADCIKKITVASVSPGNVVLTLMKGGGVSIEGEHNVVKPDTVYVAFASNTMQPLAGGTNNNNVLGGAPTTNLGTLGAIVYGADPFTLGGNAPAIPSGPDSYSTSVSAAPNHLMVFDPDQPQKVGYMESPVRGFWLAFNVSGTKLFMSTDQQAINVYNTVQNNVLIAQIPVGGAVTDMVRAGNLIYASIMSTGRDSIMVIDPQRGAAIRAIPTPNLSSGMGAHPRSVAATADGSRLYVALDGVGGNQGEVVAMDPLTTHPVAVGKCGAQPLGVAVTPDNRFVLVSNSKAATVSILDATTLQEVARVPTGITPNKIAVRPDGTKAYVSCKGSDQVCVINLQTMSPGAMIPVGQKPMGVAVSSTGAKVYVGCWGSGTVSIIDGNADTYLKATTPQPTSKPFGVVIKP